MSGSLSGAPKVTLTELDVSGGAASTGGAYCAMVIPAPRGPIGTGVLITDEASLVRTFTPEGTIRPEYDTSFFIAIEALRKTNKLWISRAANEPFVGGAYVRVAGALASGATNAAAPTEFGFNGVDHYDITSADGRINPGPVVFTADATAGYLTVTGAAYASLLTGDVVTLAVTGAALPAPLAPATNYFVIKGQVANKVQLALTSGAAAAGTPITLTSAGSGGFTLTCSARSLTNSAWTPDLATNAITVSSAYYDLVITGDVTQVAAVSGTLPEPLAASTNYFLIKTGVVNKLQLAASLPDAQNGNPIDLTSTGSGVLELMFQTITATAPGQDKAVVFYAADGGAYTNNLSFTLVNYATNPTKVKEPGAFLVQFYYNGVVLPQENWLCSFDPAHKDGRNQSIFISDVLNKSKYVRAEVNPLLDPVATRVADVLTPVPFAGGSDGLAITDSSMVAALNVLNVPGRYPITFVSDSGWATPAYHAAVIGFAEGLGSTAAFVAGPYQNEVSSNALIDVVAYAQSIGSQSSHAGIFAGYVQVTDRYNNRSLWISPVGNVMADYAYAFDKLSPGQPVGGQFGPVEVTDIAHHWSDGEMDYLYDNNVNPIRYKLGKGIQIWGQKTMQSRPSDLDRLNARMLLMVIEPALRDAYENFLFTRNGVTNDGGNRAALTLLTDGYMSTQKARGGVYNWLTICNDTNNSLYDVQNETVNIWLLVQIVKATEYIPFTVCVAPTSVSLAVSTSFING